MNRTLKAGLIATLIIYVCGLSFTYFTNEKFNQQFDQFDKDENGIIDGLEKTKESQVFLRQMSKRKTTGQAVIMLIPVSIILGLFIAGIVYLFRKIKIINSKNLYNKPN